MSILDSAIGWIAPPVCIICQAEGSSLCQDCARSELVPFGARCFDCGVVSPGGRTCEHCRQSSPRHVWVVTNYEAAAKELVKIYKFGHQRVASESIVKLLAKTILGFNSLDEVKLRKYIVVPVPTATTRIRERGFDHSALLAKQLARKLNINYLNALARLSQTRQLGTARSIRLNQADGSYVLRYPKLVAGQNILLIDDVVTTGATLRAATKELRQAGAARIDALIFAKRL